MSSVIGNEIVDLISEIWYSGQQSEYHQAMDGMFPSGFGGYVNTSTVPQITGRFRKEGVWMMTIEGLIAVIALCFTAYAVGYSHGRDSKKSSKK